jgi:hypothetical protein
MLEVGVKKYNGHLKDCILNTNIHKNAVIAGKFNG